MQETLIDINVMRSAAKDACRIMKVLSNPDRLLLLCQIMQGEKCVGDLETLLGIVQPTLSQQLGILRQEGLVLTRREGKNIYYRVSNRKVLAVMETLYEQFCPPPEPVSSRRQGIAS
ncbi:MAG: ArsR/SmtB family transcription factor [Burkholderiaceae bacterium]